MKKYGRIFNLIILLALMMINSLSVLGAEGLDLGNWETKAEMLTARRSLGIVGTISGKIYAIGGYDLINGYLDTVEVYDSVTNTWTTKSSMPTARVGHGVAEVNGKVYAIGGLQNTTYLDTVEEYDPVTDTWTTKASMPTARTYLAVVEVNGKIYAIGGYNSNGDRLDTVEEYDPETNTWSTKASMQTVRHGLGVAEVNGKIYAVGGYNNSLKYLATVEEYDPQTDTWLTKASMSEKKSVLGVVEANGKIYAIGGFTGSSSLNTVEEYDPVTDIWGTKSSMPTARYYIGVAEVNDKIYAIGGIHNSTTYLATVEEFTPPSSTVINYPTNLTASPSSNAIVVNWDAVTEAESYTILRSTVSGTVDTAIATNIIDTTYTDTNVTPGVTYYYVVRAVKNGVESADSNIASAMVEISNNRALLLIKLLDENDIEYDLPMNDVDAFMSWYFNRGIGQGPVYYAFTKDYNTGPYISRKEYISYDKIICIEVNEYIK